MFVIRIIVAIRQRKICQIFKKRNCNMVVLKEIGTKRFSVFVEVLGTWEAQVWGFSSQVGCH